MATVDKITADLLKKLDGRYDDDPRVMRIVEYTNMAGNQAYGIEYAHELGRYQESEFVRNPKVYWEAAP